MAGIALGFALTCGAGVSPTALTLANKGDDYVGIQSKDKVLQITSDKSVGSLAPNVWHVVYYDPDTPQRIVDVKFGGGQETDITHFRPFELPAKGENILDKSKLKVDSDHALTIAAAQPLVKGLSLRASKMTLTQGELGPVWKVQLWAAKLNDPTHEADVGTVVLSATDGGVVKSDLHPGRTQ